MAFEKEFENLFRSFAELREQQAELRQSQKQTDEQMKRTDEQMKRTDEQMKRTDEKLERIGIKLGNISNNNGDYAEDFFWNAVRNKKEFEGIKINYAEANVKPLRREGVEDEFDILLWNGSSVIIIETKYKVHPSLIKQLKEKKIPNFKTLVPEKKDLKIYCAIAGFAISDEVANLAKREGFFVLRQSGENVIIEKDEIKAY